MLGKCELLENMNIYSSILECYKMQVMNLNSQLTGP